VAAEHLKVVIEPSGAAALAAVLATPPRGAEVVAVVLSGGNVDAELFADVLRTRGAARRRNSP
jgi:threonine dehydratase